MARSSRLKVCLEIVIRNSSQSHWIRSIKRQRTTPWMAGIGPLLDDDLQGLSVLIVEPRRSPWRSAGQKALGSMRVEAQHPIAHDLPRHAADLSRLGPGGPIIDRGQSQKAAGLIGIPRALRQSAELGGIKVTAERDGNSHGDLQTGDRLRESYLCPPGNPPHESTRLRLGIIELIAGTNADEDLIPGRLRIQPVAARRLLKARRRDDVDAHELVEVEDADAHIAAQIPSGSDFDDLNGDRRRRRKKIGGEGRRGRRDRDEALQSDTLNGAHDRVPSLVHGPTQQAHAVATKEDSQELLK